MREDHINSDIVLSLRNVCVERDEHNAVVALNNINLDVRKGELVCIIGGEGSGKSSLLSVACGKIIPDSGSALLEGHPMTHSCVDTPMLLNPPILMPWVKLTDFFRMTLEVCGICNEENLAIRDKYIAFFELEKYMQKTPDELPDDVRLWAILAQYMICKPKLIIMDDPFFHFDPITRMTLQRKLREVSQQTDVSILFGTRSLDEAIRLGSRIVVMSKQGGEIVKEFCLTPNSSPEETMDIGKRIYRYYYSGDFRE